MKYAVLHTFPDSKWQSITAVDNCQGIKNMQEIIEAGSVKPGKMPEIHPSSVEQ